MKVSDLQVGKQLFVGIGVPEPLGRGEEEIRGSAYIESPVILGKCDDWTDVEATLMVAREVNTDREEHADRSLYVKGNAFLEGDDGTKVIKLDDSPEQLRGKNLNIFLYKDGEYYRILTQPAPTEFVNQIEEFKENDISYWNGRAEKYYNDYIKKNSNGSGDPFSGMPE